MSARSPLGTRAPLTARTRPCPHCKAVILESASVCPGCRHHLKFDPVAAQRQGESRTAMRIEGTIRGPDPAEPCEYCVTVAIRDAHGKESRHVIGVGAMRPGEERAFMLAVEVLPPAGPRGEARPPGRK